MGSGHISQKESRSKPRIAIVAVAAVAAGGGPVAASFTVEPAHAVPSQFYKFVKVDWATTSGIAGMYNWDNNNQATHYSTASFPVTVLFHENAEIDKVKGELAGRNWTYGTTNSKNSWSISQSGWSGWDTDSGKKKHDPISCYTTYPFCEITLHYRIYGQPSIDRNFSLDWGYFVYATTHRDLYEDDPANEQYGFSEDVEKQLVGDLANEFTTVADGLIMHNAYNSVDGNHVYQSNGFASTVKIV